MLVATACAGGDGDGEGEAGGSAAEPVKIGLVLPRSGAIADYGLGAQAGIEFVVDQINEEGGIESLDGAQIELVVADTGSNTSTAASEARRLIDQENVSMILGPVSTPEAQATAPVTERARIPALGLETTGVWGEDYFWIVSIEATQLGTSYADFIDWLATEQDQDVETVVITYANNDYGIQNAEAAQERLEELGYEVLDSIPVDPAVDDYTPTVLRIREQAPDVSLNILYTRDGELFHNARYAVGYHDPIFVCGIGGCDSKSVWEALPPDVAAGTLGHRLFSESLFNSSADLEPMKELVEAAEGVVDVPIDQHFIIGAQAARIVQAALEQAGSSDPEAINEAMDEFESEAGSEGHYLPTALNGIRYKDGVIVDIAAVFNQWSPDGTQQMVYPPEVAQAEPRIDE
jgi:branched-chain amino acid transport system substrate-binding protein